MTEKLSLAAARRIVLAAQGFADPKPGAAIDRRHLKRVLARLGLFQIDSVSVVVRAHYMPLFSRLGAYPRALVDEAALGRRRLLFEYWAHEASLLPVETYPLMRWRMERAARGEGIYGGLAQLLIASAPTTSSRSTRRWSRNGPVAASDFDGERGSGGWWGWSDTKRALEFLFWAGRITTASRRPSFERLYDLPERVLPAALVAATPRPSRRRRGVPCSRSRRGRSASPPPADLRDYFRMSPADADPQIGELVEAGTLLPVKVEGWPGKAFLHAGCRRPRRVSGAGAAGAVRPADLGAHAHRAAVRLPLSDRDLHSGRKAGLRLLRAAVPPWRTAGGAGMPEGRPAGGAFEGQCRLCRRRRLPTDTAEALLGELTAMAAWLELEGVEIADSGDLAPMLRAVGGRRRVAA